MCERATILPPQSKIGVIDQITRNKIINNSPFAGKYDEDIDDRSASEIIKEHRDEENKIKEEKESMKAEEKRLKEEEKAKAKEEKEKNKAEREKKNTPQYKLGKKVVNKTTDKLLNKIINYVLKGLFK